MGQPAEILLDALPDTRFRGRISRIVPTVDRAKATVMTKVKFDAIDPRILPEMSAKVSFLSQDVTPEQQKPLVAVAADAIAQRDGRTVVFVVRDGVATAVPVTPGMKIGDLTAITGDVKSGDKVVLKPGREPRVGHAGEAPRSSARTMTATCRPSRPSGARRRHAARDAAAGRDPQPHQVLHARRAGHPGAGRHQPRRHARATSSR